MVNPPFSITVLMLKKVFCLVFSLCFPMFFMFPVFSQFSPVAGCDKKRWHLLPQLFQLTRQLFGSDLCLKSSSNMGGINGIYWEIHGIQRDIYNMEKKYGWFNGILRGYGSWMAQTWWISWRCNGDEMRYAQIGILAAFIGICCYLWCVQFKGFVSWCCLTVFWWYIVGNGAFHTNLK